MNGRTVRWLMSFGHRSGPVRSPRLTIIRHHRVFAEGEAPLYRIGVSESVLARQLALLARMGRAPLTVSDALARLAEGRPGRWFAMTFDDGYADNVTRALPLLEAHGARATFYLTAGLMESRRAPWWDELAHRLEAGGRDVVRFEWEGRAQILELGSRAGRATALHALLPAFRTTPDRQEALLEALGRATGASDAAPCRLATWDQAAELAGHGMEIGAHTMGHPFLSLLEPERQRAEIAESIALIETRLGVRPAGLAYPGGDHDARTLAVIPGTGLAHAVTTRAGDAGPGGGRFELPRRGLPEGACLGPTGRFSARLARAELDGAFDRMRAGRAAA